MYSVIVFVTFFASSVFSGLSPRQLVGSKSVAERLLSKISESWASVESSWFYFSVQDGRWRIVKKDRGLWCLIRPSVVTGLRPQRSLTIKSISRQVLQIYSQNGCRVSLMFKEPYHFTAPPRIQKAGKKITTIRLSLWKFMKSPLCISWQSLLGVSIFLFHFDSNFEDYLHIFF